MTTRTTEEAMDLLSGTRAYYIERGRYEAVCWALANGTVHSRQVRQRMEQQGVFSKGSDLKDFWLGVVFRSPVFTWTGARFVYTDDSRNIHERAVKIWRLTNPAEALTWAKEYWEAHK